MENALKKAPKCAILTMQGDRAVCPSCGRISAIRLRPDTALRNFPLYCRFCRRETIVNTVEPEPDAEPLSQTQSQSRS